MQDEIFGRLWQAHHHEFSDAFDRALGLVGTAFSRITSHAVPLLSAVLLAAVLLTATLAAGETAAVLVFTGGIYA